MNKVLDVAGRIFCFVFVISWFIFDYIKYGLLGFSYED